MNLILSLWIGILLDIVLFAYFFSTVATFGRVFWALPADLLVVLDKIGLNSINDRILSTYPNPVWFSVNSTEAIVWRDSRSLFWCPRFSPGYRAIKARRAQLLVS